MATKICTNCHKELDLAEFYRKGDRTDSRCKACIKDLKRARYINKEQVLRIETLLQFAEAVTEIEIKLMRQEILRLDQEIEKWNQKTQPSSSPEFRAMINETASL